MRTALALFFLAVSAAPVRAQGPLAEALRKGVIEEESNQNLKAAIQNYKSVVAQYDAQQAKLPKARVQAASDPAAEAARAKYRDTLLLAVDFARKNSESAAKAYTLGANEQIQVVAAHRGLVESELKLAAFDAGLVPGPGGVRVSAATGAAQSNESRQAVATALFRLGECYRKLGNGDQATAAYARVVKEFPEQTKLAASSRARLPASFKGAGAASADEARRKCRSLLVEYVETARQVSAFNQLQFELGAIGDLETYGSRMQLADAESRLGAWDAGLFDVALQPTTVQQPGSANWPRSRIDILKDQLDAQNALAGLEKVANPTQAQQYQMRRLRLTLAQLKAELEYASKQ
jgi:hypothetical protein